MGWTRLSHVHPPRHFKGHQKKDLLRLPSHSSSINHNINRTTSVTSPASSAAEEDCHLLLGWVQLVWGPYAMLDGLCTSPTLTRPLYIYVFPFKQANSLYRVVNTGDIPLIEMECSAYKVQMSLAVKTTPLDVNYTSWCKHRQTVWVFTSLNVVTHIILLHESGTEYREWFLYRLGVNRTDCRPLSNPLTDGGHTWANTHTHKSSVYLLQNTVSFPICWDSLHINWHNYYVQWQTSYHSSTVQLFTYHCSDSTDNSHLSCKYARSPYLCLDPPSPCRVGARGEGWRVLVCLGTRQARSLLLSTQWMGFPSNNHMYCTHSV